MAAAEILVIDDEEDLARIIEYALAREHRVSVATDAREGLSMLLSDRRFDLVICDLVMPEIDGIRIHREVEARRPELSDRMVFITGGGFTPEIRGFIDGVPNERIIRKPFRLKEIRDFVAQFLQKRETEPRS